MRNLIFITMLFGFGQLTGQSFDEKQRFLMPTYDEIVKMQWADMDNDSLLDVVVGYKILDQFKVVAFQNGAVEPWPTYELLSTVAMEAISFQVIDINKDGQLDIVVENDQTHLALNYRNAGNFLFQVDSGWGSREVFNRGLQYVDLNNDSDLDTVWTDGASLKIGNHKDTTWLKIESFLVVDLDNNGFRDIAFSGIDGLNSPLTFVWYFGNGFKIISRQWVSDLSGQLATGDLNHDGRFDLVISGKNISGEFKTNFFENLSIGFSQLDSTTGLSSSTLLIADFTSDGMADIALSGKDSGDTFRNWIQTSAGDSILLSADLKAQAFGDFDCDGDLDWGYIKNDSLHIKSNEWGENKGPGIPTRAIALPVLNRVFFYWDKPGDDYTPVPAITYDLRVFNSDTTIVSADFNADYYHRLKPSHGNTGTNNFSLLRISGEGTFEIQAVDNSFTPLAKSICSGSMPGPGVCATIETQKILTCGTTPIALAPPAPQALWFSFSNGFIGVGDSYTFDPVKTDTVFSFNPIGDRSCASLRVFEINENPTDTIYLTHALADCENRNITLEVEAEWNNVQWKNNRNTTVVNAQSIIHKLKQPIIFTAKANNQYGCALKETFDLKLSKPDLQLDGTHFQIVTGGSVQLSASGAESYDWSPSSDLSDHEIANPIASPTTTTEYSVTAFDSLGCSVQGQVLIEVFEEAFIPTLFTPNDDTRNDNLRIYGLTQASDFHFSIYNREGVKLYETTSVTEATQSGWSGKVNGTAQASGTYYWKIEGKMPKGELLLNGKKNGAFLLVR